MEVAFKEYLFDMISAALKQGHDLTVRSSSRRFFLLLLLLLSTAVRESLSASHALAWWL